MYESLLKLPYFQGMSKDELTAILDKVKFSFSRHKDGERIIAKGENCDNFVILIQGELESERSTPDNGYKLFETITAPFAIEPGSMYGIHTDYRHSYYAKGECSILTISKAYLYSEFSKHHIFGINLLNLISRQEQMLDHQIWRNIPQSIEGRIARFISLRSELQIGQKRLIIKMEELAHQLSETRINISRALNSMQQQGLLELSRKEILVPSLENLLDTVWPQEE
ncbi:MAG: Crp/Fnr family transcriptional regulator [Bacteroidaceae bacterium]|nr:Crp/Fnr family transcriptional regulator [Bacteroidaceae bacterium]